MNRNSQYINQMNISIGELARLTFNEVTPPNNEIIQVITISMSVEFLKVVYDTVGKTLSDHAESIKNMHSNKDVN